MPNVFKGNTSIEATSDVTELPFTISFFTVANKNAGDTTINVVVQKDLEQISIVPQDLILNKGDMLQATDEQVMLAGSQIKVTTTASVDYYFTINNITPP